ncbi:MAG: hypothetical protein WC551_00400 [Patescibacteria group bacterium]
MSEIDDKLAKAEEESADGRVPTEGELAELITDYEKTLSLPDDIRKPQLLVCPVGLVGAGKSTVIKPLSDKLGLVRISTDEIRHLLKDRGFTFALVEEIGLYLLKKNLIFGFSVAIDADCAGSASKFIQQVPQKFPKAKIVWLHINPPEEFILNKLKNFKHTWLFKDADEAIANYFRRKPLHDHLDMPFLYTFDTSRPDLEKQIEEAVGLIEGIN